MSTKGITPSLANSLRSLAENQLQTQTSRSGALDAGAVGLVSACAAIAAIVLNARSAHHFWIAALALLALSLGLAVRGLLLPGADQTGPPVEGVLNARQTFDDKDLEEGLLIDLATETSANRQALTRKDLLLARALILLVLAIALELAGVQ
jgi:hypothetical protein